MRLALLAVLIGASSLTALTYGAGSAAASPGIAYVANAGSGTVTPIEIATNKPGPEIKVGSEPAGVAITPDGKTAYITDYGSGTVTPIEVATNTPGSEIKVGGGPEAVAITPDGKIVYVTNEGSGTVTPIEVATNSPGPEINVGSHPVGVAITPDGKTAYVANYYGNTVTPIDVATNTPGPEIKVGTHPRWVAITPDGKTVYVTNEGSGTVTPIEVATNTPGPEIKVGSGPFGVAITPATEALGSGVSLSLVNAEFFGPATAGEFTAAPPETPLFSLTVPQLNWNPPGGGAPGGLVPCTNSTGIEEESRPFTDVIQQADGSCTTIVAEGNGEQAGVGSLFEFQAVFSSTITVATAGKVALQVTSDDGWVIGIGPGPDGDQPTYVSGELENPPASGKTPFHGYQVVGSFNYPTGAIERPLVVDFPAAGTYPIEIDYFEDRGGAVSLMLRAREAPPTAEIKSPASGGVYKQGEMIHTSFSCTEGQGGPGIATCTDEHGVPSTEEGTLETTMLGKHTYTVTATSGDGLTGTATIEYEVIPAAPACSTVSGVGSFLKFHAKGHVRVFDELSTTLKARAVLNVRNEQGSIQYGLRKLTHASCGAITGGLAFSGEGPANNYKGLGYTVHFSISIIGKHAYFSSTMTKGAVTINEANGEPLTSSTEVIK